MLKNIETIWLSELNLNQLNDVKHLLSDCEKRDQGGPIIYPNSLSTTRLPEVNGLIYFHQKLIAFVSAYFFYKTACECSLMVAPEYRQHGLAKVLLNSLIPILKSQQIETVYFSTSSTFSAQKFPSLSFYTCEYQLARTLDDPIEESPSKLNFRTAKMSDIESLCVIDQACFANHAPETMARRFKEVIQNPHYHLIIGELEGQAIAKAHIHWQQQNAILSDIAVLPAYQQQGYGSDIVHACLLASQQRAFKWVRLEVESKNEGALKLYLNHGFKVTKETNYWQMAI